MSLAIATQKISRKEYELFRKLVYEHSGINLGDQKAQLVCSRLGKRLREGGFGSFREYYDFIQEDETGEELCRLLDAISTNTTHLFREPRHFEILAKFAHHWAADRQWQARHGSALRVWSAGCSSGEEPHSIAIVLHQALSKHAGSSCKVLATDLSVRMLRRAEEGRYQPQRLGTVPKHLRSRYFHQVRTEDGVLMELLPEAARMINFGRFNLMSQTFPFRHGFDIIFCRNVMIYFDRETQEALVSRFTRHLHPGGYLMIGHSESLNVISHTLEYVEPAVYRRPAGQVPAGQPHHGGGKNRHGHATLVHK